MRTKEEKKAELLDAGFKAFYEKGYNGTGVKELVDLARIPKGSFYNYFENKEQFAVESMQYFTEKELEFCNRHLTDTSYPPLIRIMRLFDAKIDFFIRKRAFTQGCFLSNMTLEMADVNTAIADAASHAFEQENKPILRCLEEAKKDGSLNSSHDPKYLSDLIQSSWLGTLVVMKANKNDDAFNSFRETLEKTILT
jgi:TetR/AcrR family transcriptional repressor of nem operon